MKTLIKNKDFRYIVAIVIMMVAAVLTFQEIANATSHFVCPPGDPFCGLRGIGEGASLPGTVATHGQSSTEPGAAEITSIIFVITDVIKYFVGILAVAWLIISGVRLVSAGEGIEKASESQKKNIGYSIAALIIVILADVVVKKVIFGEAGDVFETESGAKLYAQQGVQLIEGIYGFVTKFIGAIAVLMVVINGIGITVSLGAEEAMKKYRTRILWSLAALILVLIAEFVVREIIFPNLGTELPNVEKTKMLIKDFTNFIAGFLSTAAVLTLIYAGFLYVTGASNEDNTKKAKTLIIGAIIGLVLALGAFAIVSTVVKLEKVADSPAPIGASPF